MIPRLFIFKCNDCNSVVKSRFDKMLEIISLRCCPFCCGEDYTITDENGKGVN